MSWKERDDDSGICLKWIGSIGADKTLATFKHSLT